jgi:hypothetical protein
VTLHGVGYDAGLGIGLGGAALALGAHRVVFLYLVAWLPLPLFFRFVVLVSGSAKLDAVNRLDSAHEGRLPEEIFSFIDEDEQAS